MMRTSGRCELCLLNDLSQDNLGLTLRPFLEQLNENTKPSRSHTLLEPLYQHLCAPTLQLISTAGASAARPSLPHYLIDCTRTPPFCTCRDHCRRGGQRGAFSVTLLTFTSLFFPVWTHFRKHVKARLLQMHWGDSARERAGDSLVSYLQARGVDGTADEIMGTVRGQLKQVESSAFKAMLSQENSETIVLCIDHFCIWEFCIWEF